MLFNTTDSGLFFLVHQISRPLLPHFSHSTNDQQHVVLTSTPQQISLFRGHKFHPVQEKRKRYSLSHRFQAVLKTACLRQRGNYREKASSTICVKCIFHVLLSIPNLRSLVRSQDEGTDGKRNCPPSPCPPGHPQL